MEKPRIFLSFIGSRMSFHISRKMPSASVTAGALSLPPSISTLPLAASAVFPYRKPNGFGFRNSGLANHFIFQEVAVYIRSQMTLASTTADEETVNTSATSRRSFHIGSQMTLASTTMDGEPLSLPQLRKYF